MGVPVDLFVFDRAPEAFGENVVDPAALAIHADPDARWLEPIREGHACEWAALNGALIGVEDLRLAVLVQSIFSSLQVERHIVGIDSRQLNTLRLNQSMTAAR